MCVTLRAAVMLGAVAVASWGTVRADIYKYVDAAGNVYFTDAPLQGSRYRLEWHRESRKVAREVTTRLKPEPSTSIASRGRIITSQSVAVLNQSQSQRRALYHHFVLANARRYGLSPSLLHAVIRAESAYNPAAVSRAGAQGLMQLMPGTAARYGVRDSFDPAENIRGGSAYLRDLLDLFDQDVKLALAGYNAGEGAVIKHGRQIPPYTETQDYVRKVLSFYAAERPNSFIMSAR
ncbi:lytic transglycosylase domain-containing protein [Allochromatium vinosum]|uniref:Lytic transglycosylase catalytic n=2 Tax=Allochromatium vinosum TaxID=1049 RepID=D3RSR7_ALLVD|nr:transglycosylase SLT domain-containing protein [Allochromatium vinosum]ADC62226.1 Lytic transglycosylase catalytic [Allochromatium vinosum DSM 180]MBK1653555.1 lytic transglycosylase [Allochromatium vinosum]